MAASWVDITPTDSPFTISATFGKTTSLFSVYYAPSPADDIKYYDDNINDQSSANIQSVIETQFGLTSGSLTPVSQCDNPTSDCTGATGGTGTGNYSNTFTSQGAFNYLAVHFGQGELIFHWEFNLAGGTTFEIGGLPRGLSNYRAYTDGNDHDNPPVPVPAAVWLFGTALASLGAFRKREAFRLG